MQVVGPVTACYCMLYWSIILTCCYKESCPVSIIDILRAGVLHGVVSGLVLMLLEAPESPHEPRNENTGSAD